MLLGMKIITKITAILKIMSSQLTYPQTLSKTHLNELFTLTQRDERKGGGGVMEILACNLGKGRKQSTISNINPNSGWSNSG